MYIERPISDRLKTLAIRFPCVILTGARQTGKTTLLKHLYPDYSFVSLDLPSLAELAEKKPAEFLSKYPPPVVIDEIQYAPGLFRHLKVAIDAHRSKKGQYLLTGSQKFTLMKEVSESLTGRSALLDLDTLSAREYASVRQRSHADWSSFLLRGGFPELVVDPEMPAADFYHAYLSTYLERDLRSLLRVGSLRDFERFMRFCATRSAQLLNLSELSRDVGITVPTAKEWLSALEASNQIHLLEPYFKNVGKRMIKAPKLYMMDTGFLCYLLGISTVEQMLGSGLMGAIWENFIFGQMLRELRQTSQASTLWFWRDAHGHEANFLIEEGGACQLWDAKWTEHPDAKDVGKIKKILGLLPKKIKKAGGVVCRAANAYPLDDGISAVNGFLQSSYRPQVKG